MKKLVIGMLAVGLLGLLTVSAIGGTDTSPTLYTNATIAAYYDLTVTDGSIEFGTLLAADAGWKTSGDTATATIAANVDLCVDYWNGDDLTNNDCGTHYLETELRTGISGSGSINWNNEGGISLAGLGTVWGAWAYCGLAPGTADAGPGDSGTIQLLAGHTYNITIKARVMRQGIKDYRGSYTTHNTMSIYACCW